MKLPDILCEILFERKELTLDFKKCHNIQGVLFKFGKIDVTLQEINNRKMNLTAPIETPFLVSKHIVAIFL